MLSLAAPPGFFAVTDRVVGGARRASRCVVGLASGNAGAGGVWGCMCGVWTATRTWRGTQSIPVLALRGWVWEKGKKHRNENTG